MARKPATNPNRHVAQCTICAHEDLAAIDAAYLAYRPVDEIAADYSVCRDAVYRHAKALNLEERRSSNILGLCSWILEKGQLQDIEVTPALLANAMQLSAKIRGQLVDRTLDLTTQLRSASDAELDFFELHGRLPTAGELQDGPDGNQ